MVDNDAAFDAFGLNASGGDDGAAAAKGFDPFSFDDSAQADGYGGNVFDPFKVDGEAARGFRKQPRETDAVPPTPDSAAAPVTPLKTPDSAKASPPLNLSLKAADSAKKSSQLVALPPRLGVKFIIHEEASSSCEKGETGYTASRVAVEGTIQAQLQSSHAKKNVPFQLSLQDPHNAETTKFAMNSSFVDDTNKVAVPKSSIGNVPIATYACDTEIRNMPVLVQSKVQISEKLCRVDVQVRSNLNNAGDLEDFTIAVPLPQFIKSDSVKITKGVGAWDDLKRVVKWTRENLPKGHSFMVGCQGEVSGVSPMKGDFPILLRCKSTKDKISTIEIDANAVDGHPATVVVTQQCSFRLLHRVTGS